ncbi:phosphotriesterase [Microbacterium allomyrinae]|uniref:Phosphotriesterase n=1 Tax=Microbacterium allomyrinae TaxID=2830666 RepID=A0A9X1LSM7_9MICO|nr:phosphotriesterase [Microbacterium allomyrinae]MCC2031240.1 phosphotriesterase [Microbacterium allomyrinae]
MTVNTVLGPIAPEDLGVIAVHEALLSVVPGAQYAFDITIDRAEIFETLKGRLDTFKAAGGDTVVDHTGMFHGRDVRLYEALSRATGVHIIASTGMGPEENLGGYFLTPQTNPPTPWPAERFAELFAAEVTDGMVVPRVERRSGAGLVVTALSENGPTPTDESLLRGAARTAKATGVALSFVAANPDAALDIIAEEGLAADRVVIGGIDRRDRVAAAEDLAARGAYVAIDHVGSAEDTHLTDTERVGLVQRLIAAGHTDRIILSASAVGVAKGFTAPAVEYAVVLTDFVPALRIAGVADADITRILTDNPRALLIGQEI